MANIDLESYCRRPCFPEYFQSFLHQYVASLTDPLNRFTKDTAVYGTEADKKIYQMYMDFDKIAYFLGLQAEKTNAEVARPKPKVWKRDKRSYNPSFE